MADILGKIIIPPGDIDLLAGHRIGAIAIGFCFGAKRAHVRARLRFCQVHGAGPLTRDQFWQVHLFQRITGVMLQRLNLPLTHQWGKL